MKKVWNNEYVTIHSNGSVARLFYQKNMDLPIGDNVISTIPSMYSSIGYDVGVALQYHNFCRLEGTTVKQTNASGSLITNASARGVLTYLLANPL